MDCTVCGRTLEPDKAHFAHAEDPAAIACTSTCVELSEVPGIWNSVEPERPVGFAEAS